MNAPKSMSKIYFSRDGICIIFLKCPEFKHFQFLFLSSVRNLIMCNFFWNAPFLNIRDGEMKHFKIFEHIKKGHFKKFTRDEISKRKEGETSNVRFRAFQSIMHIICSICHHVKIYFSRAFRSISYNPPYDIIFNIVSFRPAASKWKFIIELGWGIMDFYRWENWWSFVFGLFHEFGTESLFSIFPRIHQQAFPFILVMK